MLRVLKPGMFTSIQDLGRFGYASIGVPIAGAMDQYSSKLANLLIGNDENDAVLEVTFNGAFQFLKETIICVSGADLNATLNDEPLLCNRPIKVNKESILKFVNPNYGIRAYTAVKGGFLNEKVLGSKGLFKDVTKKYVLRKGDEIRYSEINSDRDLSFASVKVSKEHFNVNFINVFKGPEYELLNKKQRKFLEVTDFTITKENSRMGYKLAEILQNDLGSMLTSSVLTGTVQLTPSGKLIILMRDSGVTGGYPRILQLTEHSINRLSQKTAKDRFKFNLIS